MRTQQFSIFQPRLFTPVKMKTVNTMHHIISHAALV